MTQEKKERRGRGRKQMGRKQAAICMIWLARRAEEGERCNKVGSSIR
jgi:hypothetical protein